jgi:hypothetical protein
VDVADGSGTRVLVADSDGSSDLVAVPVDAGVHELVGAAVPELVAVALLLGVPVCDDVSEELGVPVVLGDAEPVPEELDDGVPVSVADALGVPVSLLEADAVSLAVADTEPVGLTVTLGVEVRLAVEDLVPVRLPVPVADTDAVADSEAVALRLPLGVCVPAAVALGEGVSDGSAGAIATPTKRMLAPPHGAARCVQPPLAGSKLTSPTVVVRKSFTAPSGPIVPVTPRAPATSVGTPFTVTVALKMGKPGAIAHGLLGNVALRVYWVSIRRPAVESARNSTRSLWNHAPAVVGVLAIPVALQLLANPPIREPVELPAGARVANDVWRTE